MKRTAAIEDYLKGIYTLQHERKSLVSTSALAERMAVSAPAASAMVKKLASLGLVRHERYHGVSLTRAGERAAVEVIRHHRLLEQYLAQHLGLAIDEVHGEAERLEHALSEELEARIDESLGHPTHDPHGDPIPDAGLKIERAQLRRLADLDPGEQATIRRVPDDDSELLRYLLSLGLLPGEPVELVAAAPFDGPLTISAAGVERAISKELAAQIRVG